MRKRTIRSGMRMLLTSLLLIILASFYLADLSDLFSLSIGAEQLFYSQFIFWAAAIGGYGIVLAVLGLIRSAENDEAGVRILPALLLIVGMLAFFFYLFMTSFDKPVEREHLRPGETITI